MSLGIEKQSALSGAVRFSAYLGLCAAYLQGGLVKLTDFPGAIAEMTHFGLIPPELFAALVIVLQLVAPVMVLTGFWRWLGALSLGGFTLLATFIALRFWELPAGQERFMAANSFFGHLGLVGGFLLVAWLDLTKNRPGRISKPGGIRHEAPPVFRSSYRHRDVNDRSSPTHRPDRVIRNLLASPFFGFSVSRHAQVQRPGRAMLASVDPVLPPDKSKQADFRLPGARVGTKEKGKNMVQTTRR